MADYSQICFIFFLVLLSCLIKSHGYQFLVGGRDGWVLNPSESYKNWAERNRFQVNDTLLFKYKSGSSDSVMVVNKNDYDSCNAGNPIQRFEDGNSVFRFDRSGPFYFITGNKSHCDQGQKLVIVVLAVRNSPTTPPSPPLSPAPGTQPSSPSPVAEAPGPTTGAPGPTTHGSGPSPTAGAPGPATGGVGLSPTAGAPGPENSGSGTGGPGPAAGGLGPSPMGGAPGSGIGGSGPSPAADTSTTPGSPNSTPADVTSPGGRSSAAPLCAPSIIFVSVVFSVGLGGFVVAR